MELSRVGKGTDEFPLDVAEAHRSQRSVAFQPRSASSHIPKSHGPPLHLLILKRKVLHLSVGSSGGWHAGQSMVRKDP